MAAPKPKKRTSSKTVASLQQKAEKTEKVATGRISYSEELAATICEELVKRDEEGKTRSLRYVCAMEGMPAEPTVYRWLNDHETFREMYARARETLADMNANDVVHIADAATDANLARLQIDARKWWAAKVNPKRFGDKVMNEVTGKDGEALMPDTNSRDLARAVLDILREAKVESSEG